MKPALPGDTYFHAHEYEQILIVTARKGVVATEKEEKAVTAGDIVLIPGWGKELARDLTGPPNFSHFRGKERGEGKAIGGLALSPMPS